MATYMRGFTGLSAPWCMGAVATWRDQAAHALGLAPAVPSVLDGVFCLYVPRPRVPL